MVPGFHPEAWFKDDQVLEDLVPEYTFEYSFQLKSIQKITYISAPDECVKEACTDGWRVTMPSINKVPKREIKIFYKAENMLLPQLRYKIENDEVACMAAIVPTFEPEHP